MEYRGMYKHLNSKPTGEYIEIFVSDWNKDYFAFYVYISKDDYETDIEEIQTLIKKLNFRDGDVYIELINHSENLKHFYKYIYDSNHSILDKEYWKRK
jgi:hypothetical protein